jgi:hypothetical protein
MVGQLSLKGQKSERAILGEYYGWQTIDDSSIGILNARKNQIYSNVDHTVLINKHYFNSKINFILKKRSENSIR